MKERPIIETKNATINFDGLVAVDSVNFTMKEGEAIGVIGPNGAGKTTFFNLLTGLFFPTGGNIFFFDREITKVPPHKRVIMGIVRTFQLVSVFDSLPVVDNLILSTHRISGRHESKRKFFFNDAHHRQMEEKCMEALKLMGIESKADRMTAELSYGDKRKLELAVALSLDPKILLLDEPFAGLSDTEICEVSGILSEVKKKFSFVIIEHKISHITDLVERLCVMHEGKLIAEGPPAEVLCNALVREVYWGKEEGLTCSV
ncbi:MAG: ABC transporter ATP-binding protein [Deltaproteobacteria bacterium]|nr:ABC transporter ATP-binding protein [Deltaproteobacteria bacterium]